MELLEWSDSLVRFRILEKENWVFNNIDFDDYPLIELIIKFSDDKIVHFVWEIDNTTTYSVMKFNIFSEQTKWKVWSFTADIWWINGQKRIRFNKRTLKWKVLPSVKVPKWIATTSAE
jgi:hypothetical protein